MKRRAVLGALAGAVSGCSAILPREPRPPSDRAWQIPNLFFRFEQVSPDQVRITLDQGNRLTGDVEIYVETSPGETIYWVAPSKRGRQSYPLEVGDSTTVNIEESTETVRVIGEFEGGELTIYGEYSLSEQSSEGGGET